MYKIPTIIIGALTFVSCSVMILNHSNHNKLREITDPQTELPIQVMGKGNTEQVEPIVSDTLKVPNTDK